MISERVIKENSYLKNLYNRFDFGDDNITLSLEVEKLKNKLNIFEKLFQVIKVDDYIVLR